MENKLYFKSNFAKEFAKMEVEYKNAYVTIKSKYSALDMSKLTADTKSVEYNLFATSLDRVCIGETTTSNFKWIKKAAQLERQLCLLKHVEAKSLFKVYLFATEHPTKYDFSLFPNLKKAQMEQKFVPLTWSQEQV